MPLPSAPPEQSASPPELIYVEVALPHPNPRNADLPLYQEEFRADMTRAIGELHGKFDGAILDAKPGIGTLHAVVTEKTLDSLLRESGGKVLSSIGLGHASLPAAKEEISSFASPAELAVP
jgi:hypothetical protein